VDTGNTGPPVGLKSLEVPFSLSGRLYLAGEDTVPHKAFVQEMIFKNGKAAVTNFPVALHPAPGDQRRWVASEPQPIVPNRLTFKWAVLGDDVDWFRLYELNTSTGAITPVRQELLAEPRVQFAPGGESYAFVRSAPYGNDFALMEDSGGKEAVISTNRASRTFQWSPSGALYYSDFQSQSDGLSGAKYPDLMALKDGVKKVLKSQRFLGSVSPDEAAIACFKDNKATDPTGLEFHFNPDQPIDAQLTVYEPNTGQEMVVMKIYGTYPEIFWSRDGKRMYVAEKYFVRSKQTAYCRIQEWSVADRKLRLVAELRRTDTTASATGRPDVVPVGIVGDHSMLIQAVAGTTKDATLWRAKLVDLKSGKTTELVEFSAPASFPVFRPTICWEEPAAVEPNAHSQGEYKQTVIRKRPGASAYQPAETRNGIGS
jgi:hypothetical protein